MKWGEETQHCSDTPEAKSHELAAATVAQLAEKFPKSKLRENAFLRSADNFKKINRHEDAAKVYVKAANTITKADYAIPSLSAAAEAYQKVKKYDMAGKMFELIYERYANDPKTPQALYNAGLIFEKGKFYENAIKVYAILAEKFSQSEYAPEAFFSVSQIPGSMQGVVNANPVTWMITSLREIVVYGGWDVGWELLGVTVICVPLYLGAWWVFRRLVIN